MELSVMTPFSSVLHCLGGRLGVRSPLRYARAARRGRRPSHTLRFGHTSGPLLGVLSPRPRARRLGRSYDLPSVAGWPNKEGGKRKKGEALVALVTSMLWCACSWLQAHSVRTRSTRHPHHTRLVRGSWQVPLQVQVHKFLLSVEPPGQALA